jgi:uncharacterized protein YjbI with pentapeptide repeats
MIEIKRTDGKVLYVAENANDVRSALEEAVRANANLTYANLRSANLRSANLTYANLRSADLRSADLTYANLRSADLRSADLRSADLTYANLTYADLTYANLTSANLTYADLTSANLTYADLTYADLRSADLTYADLRSADLRYADLRSADLRSADLRSADLTYANLTSANLTYADLTYRNPLWRFWVDFCNVLDWAPKEVPGLRQALIGGRVDGSAYEGECACLLGTLAKERHVALGGLDIDIDALRPAEQWFLPIREGDKAIDDPAEATSEGVFRASVAVAWLDVWAANRRLVGAALGEGGSDS